MKCISTKDVICALIYAGLLFGTDIHADVPKQPRNVPHMNEPKTFRMEDYECPENDPNKKMQQNRDDALPEARKDGLGGMRLMPQSDPFPNDVTLEMAAVIMQEYPEIARKLKMLDDHMLEDKPTELLLIGKSGVGKTSIAAAIALTLKRKTIFLKSTSLAGNEMQNSSLKAIENRIGIALKDVKQSQDSYVIIIDELAPLTAISEDSRRSHLQVSLAHLCLTLDDLRKTGRVLFISTANEVKDIPYQIRSRAKRNIFEIKNMSPNYRQKTLRILLKNRHTLSDEDIKKLCERIDKQGYNVREMQDVALDAFEVAYHRGLNIVDKACANRAFEAYVKRNTKGWIESFNDYYDKHESLLTHIAKISAAVGGLAFGLAHLGPYVSSYGISLFKSAAVTKAGVIVVSVSGILVGEPAAQACANSSSLLLIGVYQGINIYVDRQIVEAIIVASEVSEKEAREIILRSIKEMSGDGK